MCLSVKNLKLIFLLFAVISMSACEHKPLVRLTKTKTYPVIVEVDWSNFADCMPTGMTVAFYSLSDGTVKTFSTNDIDSHRVDVAADFYHVTVINQSVDEFYTLDFSGLNAHSTASFIVKNSDTVWPEAAATYGIVCAEPQNIGIAVDTEVVVPDDADSVTIIRLKPKRLIYTVQVNLKVINHTQIKSVYGVLTNMAKGYHIGYDQLLSDDTTYELTDWTLNTTSTRVTTGAMQCEVRTFNVPAWHQPVAESNQLTIYMRLVDNTTVKAYTYNVGHLLVDPVDYKYIINISDVITLPIVSADVTPEGGNNGSGFDANVEGWGDEEDFDFDI